MRDAPSDTLTCPFCGSANTIPIVYGMPGGKLFDASMRGEVALGGCCVSGGDPDRSCRDCQYEWISKDQLAPPP